MPPPHTPSDHARAALKLHCNRGITGHPTPLPQNELFAIADWMGKNGYAPDVYGSGQLMADFEAKVAQLLGKPAALFMPSGKMASLIALRIWTDRAHNADFGMHPTAHLELHEEHAYKKLHGMRGRLIGKADRPILAADLQHYDVPLSALVLELPMREIGGQLPPWEDLLKQRDIARSRSTRLHLDGARLWEARAFYRDQSYADIAALFDSVYVSFYKGIGGLAGAMLLGDAAFIAEARVWLTRHGGTLYQQYPIVASAAMRFDQRLARMPEYFARTQAFVAAVKSLPGIAVLPDPPQVNLVHLRFDIPAHRWEAARDHLAAGDRIWLGKVRNPKDTTRAEVEVYVGEGLMALSDEEVVAAFDKLLAFTRMGGDR
ncbi:MAG: threonine aldolase [Betaproteobacteria bacterium]|nr:threonine aldolase [Betaproteobacteria bacterium]